MCSKIIHSIFGTEKLKDIVPGLFLAVMLTIIAYLLSNVSDMFIPGNKNPFSPVLCAMLGSCRKYIPLGERAGRN